MPFDLAPQPEVAKFQKFADAILRGCAVLPIQCTGSFFAPGGAACALGAMAVGMGFRPIQRDSEDSWGDPEMDVEDFLPDAVCNEYLRRYGHSIPDDNDKNGLTREEIAARVAAL